MFSWKALPSGGTADDGGSSEMNNKDNQSCWFNTLRPRQNGRHFVDDVFKCIFLNENVWISLMISLKFAPNVPINNIPVLVQIMALNQSWLVYWRMYASLGLTELRISWVQPSVKCVTLAEQTNIDRLIKNKLRYLSMLEVMSDKVRDETIYPLPKFSGTTVEVWEWLSNFIHNFKMDVITYPCWDWSYCLIIKGAPGQYMSSVHVIHAYATRSRVETPSPNIAMPIRCLYSPGNMLT